MTNIEIIEKAKTNLVANGIIESNEELHTYNHWKQLGYQVFKGEKAVVSLVIWKNTGKKKDDDEDGEAEKKQGSGYMIHKRAYFFSTKQVFKLDD